MSVVKCVLLSVRFILVAVLLREEVAQLQEEVSLLRQMKDMLSKDLEETQGSCSADVLSATELRVQLAQKEQELDRAKEALQGNRPGINERGGECKCPDCGSLFLSETADTHPQHRPVRLFF